MKKRFWRIANTILIATSISSCANNIMPIKMKTYADRGTAVESKIIDGQSYAISKAFDSEIIAGIQRHGRDVVVSLGVINKGAKQILVGPAAVTVETMDGSNLRLGDPDKLLEQTIKEEMLGVVASRINGWPMSERSSDALNSVLLRDNHLNPGESVFGCIFGKNVPEFYGMFVVFVEVGAEQHELHFSLPNLNLKTPYVSPRSKILPSKIKPAEGVEIKI